MYDTLEGLDYRTGELSHYVSQVLLNVEKSKENGDLKYILIEGVKMGDVAVKPYSSHLVLDKDYYQWAITRRSGDNDQILVIPKEVLDQLRLESST